MWYSVEENIGTMTVIGEFTYHWADDEEATYHYVQMIFECDEYGDLDTKTGNFDEIYW